MAQTSRQFEHLQAATLKRLEARIPHECPLVVRRVVDRGAHGFAVNVLDAGDGTSGRFQVVAAWIDGYVTAWKAQT